MRRFFRFSLWALLAVFLISCLVVVFIPFPMPSLVGNSRKTYPETTPPPSFSISEETTVLTAPLGPDGYVNYVAAANQRYGEGVTPDNNAVLPLLEALGFGYFARGSYDRFFELLGAQPPEPLENTFVSFKSMADDYVEEHEEAYRLKLESDESPREYVKVDEGYVLSTGDMPEEHPRIVIEHALHEAESRPWSAEEFPEIADWLARNRDSLDRIGVASERTRYFAPLLGLGPDAEHTENAPFIAVFLAVTGGVSEAGKAFQVRAMSRIRRGQIDEAWQDLMTLHRLSRLVGQEPALMSRTISYGLEQRTLNATGHLIASDQFTPAHTKRMMRDLQSLAPNPKVDSLLHETERYSLLDTIGWMAREATVPEHGIVNRLTHPFVSLMIDWDIPFHCANDWFDAYEEANAKPNFAERMAAFEQVYADLRRVKEESSRTPSIAGSLLSGCSPRAEVSRVVGQTICVLMLPDVSGCLVAETRALATARLNLVGAAMAVFRAEQGRWPEAPEELVPEYLEELPNDPFADAPLRYVKDGGGFVLYSVGPNLVDEQGVDSDIDEEDSLFLSEEDGDDVFLRVSRQ